MGALGYVMQVPEEEKFLNTEAELHAMLVGLLAGRAAEEIVIDTVTTGASNDIEKATSIARAMVTQYGMSKKFGLIGLQTVESQYLDGRAVMNCSDVTAAEVDSEVMKILKECYEEALSLLRENRAVMDKIAAYLIEKETITGKEFMKNLSPGKGNSGTGRDTGTARERAQRRRKRFGFRQESGSAQGQRADGNTAPQGGQTGTAGWKNRTRCGRAERALRPGWPLFRRIQTRMTGGIRSSSGIPGQDMGFFRDEEEQNEDGQDHKDGQNPPQGTVGRFSNTVIPPSDQNH